jgi:hypothetical protein
MTTAMRADVSRAVNHGTASQLRECPMFQTGVIKAHVCAKGFNIMGRPGSYRISASGWLLSESDGSA